MKIFVEPTWLYAGLPAALAVGAFLWWSEMRRLQRLKRFAANKLLPDLTASHSVKKVVLGCSLLSLSVLMIFVTLARPQWDSRKLERLQIETNKYRGSSIDVIIAVDVSRSMLVRDAEPNRIENVKRMLDNQIEKLKGNRLGLIAFAGDSTLSCPLTYEHDAFRQSLKELKVGEIKQGTNLAKAIDTAELFLPEGEEKCFLIIISDGDDLEQEGRKAAAKTDANLCIHTIGVGTEAGGPIPLDPVGKPPRKFYKEDGQVIKAMMDASWLRAIADATGGEYQDLGKTGNGLEKIFSKLQEIGNEKRQILNEKEQTTLTKEFPIERYQLFLGMALVFMVVEFVVGNRRFVRSQGPLVALTILFLFPGCLQEDNLRQAEDAFEEKDYSKAAELYESEIQAREKKGESVDPRLLLNAGLSFLEAGDLAKSKRFLNESLTATREEPLLQSTTLNAMGNLNYGEARMALESMDWVAAKAAWEKARQNYKDAVAIDDNDKAKRNLRDLEKQIQERLWTISGVVWRDIDGNGKKEPVEGGLPAKVFWFEKQENEDDATFENYVETNASGEYKIEWLSVTYPLSIQLKCELLDGNATKDILLIAVSNTIATNQGTASHERETKLPKADHMPVINFAFRKAPVLQGFVWNDEDHDGALDDNETGYDKVRLYLDNNANGKWDQNEFSFQPAESGEFSQPITPSQKELIPQPIDKISYLLRIAVNDQNAEVTFPLKQFHSGKIKLESSPRGNLDFGVYSPNQADQDSDQNQAEQKPDPQTEQEQQANKEQEDSAQNQEPQASEELNALYNSLLEEFEFKSKQLRVKESDTEKNISQGKGRGY